MDVRKRNILLLVILVMLLTGGCAEERKEEQKILRDFTRYEKSFGFLYRKQAKIVEKYKDSVEGETRIYVLVSGENHFLRYQYWCVFCYIGEETEREHLKGIVVLDRKVWRLRPDYKEFPCNLK
ncbi:hypothetical protein H8S37_03675 [Mediterraneibacter sp. NSJ-55]|uniref:Lipoprotein n=1 Tax=Mediterraneibacter hominis TaxID=2763054 RepID=A0A923RP20_9FIRM|nr:hypothetical protein [Mediterraneibacter hominis]MBC5688034.1 hypothetical protein [Mediterraneibacter hominis]